jgi:tyrosyl-tRNA synthetase
MFGKTMALPDETLVSVFTDCTYVKMDEIKKIQESLTSGVNPRDIKVRLAKELVTMYHGALAAETAAKAFENTFKKGEIPSDTITTAVTRGSKLVDVLVEQKIVASKNEFRRLVLGNGVSEFGSDTPITDAEYTIECVTAFRIGKKRFIKVTLK